MPLSLVTFLCGHKKVTPISDLLLPDKLQFEQQQRTEQKM